MKNTIKTLALVTTGLVVGVVVGRVYKDQSIKDKVTKKDILGF